MICNGPGGGDGGAGAGTGRPGISGTSVGCPPGGIPSVGSTASLVKPFGSMWSLQKLVEFMTTMYSLHNPGGLGAGDVTPSGQRQVQLAPAIGNPAAARTETPVIALDPEHATQTETAALTMQVASVDFGRVIAVTTAT